MVDSHIVHSRSLRLCSCNVGKRQRQMKSTCSFVPSLRNIVSDLNWSYRAHQMPCWHHQRPLDMGEVPAFSIWQRKVVFTQTLLARHHLSLPSSPFPSSFQPFSPLPDCISTFIWYSQNALLCCVTFLTLRGGYTLPVSPERGENSRFPSTAQQPSSPPGNNSTASLLVRTPLCHANCFVFFLRFCSSKATPLSRRQFGRRKKKKRSFFPFSKFILWNSLSPCW